MNNYNNQENSSTVSTEKSIQHKNRFGANVRNVACKIKDVNDSIVNTLKGGKKFVYLAALVGGSALSAEALTNGQPGYAYTTNWWKMALEEPFTSPKTLSVEAYIEWPFETDGHDLRIGFFLDHNNQFVGRSGQYPASIGETNGNSMLVYKNIDVSGDFEGSNRFFKGKIHWQSGTEYVPGNDHLDCEIVKQNPDDWKIEWFHDSPNWIVWPNSRTVYGVVIPESSVFLPIISLLGYTFRRKNE